MGKIPLSCAGKHSRADGGGGGRDGNGGIVPIMPSSVLTEGSSTIGNGEN
jgi:hypothetical protein